MNAVSEVGALIRKVRICVETKQNQRKPEPGVAVALVVGVPGPPPRATPGVLLHNRLDWQGLVLGVSRETPLLITV